MDREHGKAIIEVGTNFCALTSFSRSRLVATTSRNQIEGSHSSDPFKLLCLDNPQQSHLDVRAQIAHFVEEKSAAVG